MEITTEVGAAKRSNQLNALWLGASLFATLVALRQLDLPPGDN
jgi:hypothetical protein